MSGGGGGTTQNIKQTTGLTDAQYNNLQSGQGTIRGDIQAVGNQAGSQIGNLGADMRGQFSELGGQVGEVGQGVSNLGNTVNTGFNNVGNQITTMGNQVGNQVSGLGTQIDLRTGALSNQMENQTRDINESVNTGFADSANRMNTGFNTVLADQRQGFSDTRDAIDTGVSNIGSQMNTRFDAQGNQIASGFSDQANQIDTVSTNVLGGQANLRTLMEQYGGDQDRYYADLAANQANMQQGLGGIQTGLDSFRNDYGRDTTLATQQRARISDSVAGGINAVRQDIGSGQGAMDIQNRATQSQLSNLTGEVQAQGTANEDNFGTVARNIATGFSDNTAQSQQMNNDFVSRLNTIRSLVNDSSIQIDQNTRQQYADLSESFDQQGRLISRSVDQSGNQIARALDQQGNLLLAGFNQNGQRISQQALDVNTMVRQLDMLGVGTAPVTPSGLASPFATTGV